MPLGLNTPETTFSPALIMSNDTFKFLREYIYTVTGIYYQDGKKYLLESRIGRRTQALGLNTFEEYLNFIRYNPRRGDELLFLYDAITINETFFLRNEPQFEVFEKILVPQILDKRPHGVKTTLRAWSAGSSSGEEAYTLGMVFTEKIKPKYPWVDIEIVGTDINSTVLDTARQGVYREYSVRNISKEYLNKYITNNQGKFYVDAAIKKLVRFEHLNLYDKTRMRMMRSFDIIFCCNVLIYFDSTSKIQVISDLYDALNLPGFLFIGYSESLHGLSTAFKLLNFPSTVAYKKE